MVDKAIRGNAAARHKARSFTDTEERDFLRSRERFLEARGAQNLLFERET
jgi:hypothetical protein